METKTKVIRDYARQLKLTAIQGHVEKIIEKADEEIVGAARADDIDEDRPGGDEIPA